MKTPSISLLKVVFLMLVFMGQGNGQLVDILSQMQSEGIGMASAPMISSHEAQPCNMSPEEETMTAEDGCCGDTCPCPEQACSGLVYLTSQLVMPANDHVDEPALPGQILLPLDFPHSHYRPPIAV